MSWTRRNLFRVGIGCIVSGLMVDRFYLQRKFHTLSSLTDINVVVKRIAPSTVTVTSLDRKKILGAGVVLQGNHNQFYILTAAHVIENYSNETGDLEFRVRPYNGSDFKAVKNLKARLIRIIDKKTHFIYFSTDNKSDLALLEVIEPTAELRKLIQPVMFYDPTAAELEPGDRVVVVGAPFGSYDNVTVGHISHIDRKPPGETSVEKKMTTLGVDAPINPGNSGGGVFNMEGKLIGLVSSGINLSDGVNFVVPVRTIQSMIHKWAVDIDPS